VKVRVRVILIRVGADKGCRSLHANGPLLPDGRFELVPIPDHSPAAESRTYGNTVGRHGRPLAAYFPERRGLAGIPMHLDPEFDTHTYGTPARVQRSLATLEAGDLLVFYGGLRPVAEDGRPLRHEPHALYVFGYFEVTDAIRARAYRRDDLLPAFGRNFHVRHAALFAEQHEVLVLVKGGGASRLLSRARPISDKRSGRNGTPIFVLSEEMRRVFGTFTGFGSIQRCVPRWVEPAFVRRAADFVRSLP
jgi:hypothetical protein